MRGRVPSPKLTSSGGPVMRSQGLLRWGFYWREPESIVKHLYGLWQESLDQECRVDVRPRRRELAQAPLIPELAQTSVHRHSAGPRPGQEPEGCHR